MGQSSLGLLFRINADPSQAQSALESFRSKSTEQLESVRTEFSVLQRVQSAWSTGVEASASTVGNAFNVLGDAAEFAFDRIAVALGKNISTAVIYSQSMSEALARTLKSTTASIAEEAVVQALRSMALGFYLLAVGDFGGSGSAFESAALWGSIGGVAAGMAAQVTGASGAESGSIGDYSRTGSKYGALPAAGVPSSALAPGAAPPQPAGRLTVSIMGDAEAANWLANTLNQGVARGVQLTATRTQRGPYAAG